MIIRTKFKKANTKEKNKNGGPGRTRTYDRPIMSRKL